MTSTRSSTVTSKATKELWKFCFLGGSGAYAETVAARLEHLTAGGERLDIARPAG